MANLRSLIEAWDGETVVVHRDPATGTWIFIAIHDTTLGPTAGGCRMKVYPQPEDGLADALRLAEGMTAKWALIGVPAGGGKAVLAVPRPLAGEERRAVLRRFGRLLESLGGIYGTGEDLGTTPEDMAVVAEVTRHVHGAQGGTMVVDPGPYTALGVLHGIRAAVEQAFGSADLGGRSILIQGLGDVGAPLARLLREAGASLLLSDLDEERARALAAELSARVVAADAVYREPCDVYAPCAVGGTLNRETIPLLACRVVAGSANNQLAEPEDAERLHRRGILYAPDYVINAGGATALTHLDAGEDEIARRLMAIGSTLGEIFAEAAARGESPADAARRRVERILAAARERRGTVPALT